MNESPQQDPQPIPDQDDLPPPIKDANPPEATAGVRKEVPEVGSRDAPGG